MFTSELTAINKRKKPDQAYTCFYDNVYGGLGVTLIYKIKLRNQLSI